MKGARQYAEVFETGQHGRLYLVSSCHARGRTFHIYVLPQDEKAIPNGTSNPPLNNNAVEVYGVTSGHSGWTEVYGWLHEGPWQDDFMTLIDKKRLEFQRKNTAMLGAKAKKEDAEKKRQVDLLATYC